MSLVVVREAWKIFGATIALREVNAELDEGEVLLLLGPNGSGKSTLIKAVGGLLRLDKGSVTVMGRDAWRLSLKRRNSIGAALEDFHLPWWASAKAFLRHVARIKGVDWGSVEELARRLGVDKYWDRLALKYSSGMLKKAGLIQALMGKPRLLLLDEPLTMLDASSRSTLLRILEEMRGEAGMIIASHMVLGLERLVDRILVLDNGEVRASGRAGSLARTHGAAGLKCRLEDEASVPDALEIADELVARRGELLLYGVPDPSAVESIPGLGSCQWFVDLERLYERILSSKPT